MTKDTKYPHHKPRGRGNDKSQTKRDKDFKPSPGQTFTKFKGNTLELDGFVFDCSNDKQVDRYMTAMKRISEHIGTNYHNGGDICSTIEQGTCFNIPKPISPSTTNDEVDNMILTKKVNSYFSRYSILDENIQKGYSLVLGQCTELFKSKLKTTSNWNIISIEFDLLWLIASIKSVIFKFEDQQYLPLSLHYAKTNFYSFRQHHLSNTEYLENFTNLVDMAESFEGQPHSKALVDIAVWMSPNTKDVDLADIPTNRQKELNSQAKEIYLACAFISQADPHRYGRLKE